jgi:hypothetical protein
MSLSGDNYSGGHRFNSNGSMYVATDPASIQYGLDTTPGMAALGLWQQISPYGTARVSIEPGTLFLDQFDGTVIDVTNRWALAGTVPTMASGQVTLNSGTTASATSTMISQPVFAPVGVGFRIAAATISLGSQVTTPNKHSFFGLGQVTSYAIATPLTDGLGFEVDATGALNAVIYIGGTRYVVNSTNPALITAQGSLPAGASSVQTAAMTWPATGLHSYIAEDRGDIIAFYIDSTDVPIAIVKAMAPNVQALPLRIAQVNAASAVLATTFSASGITIGDSTSQSCSIADPTYMWRRQTIGNDGAASISIGGQSTAAVAAAGSANVKAAPGRLCRVLVTTAGTASITFYDNAAGGSTGTIIGVSPAVTTLGQVMDFNLPALVGISAVGGAGSPAVTIGFN